MSNTLEQVRELMRQVFLEPALEVSRDTTAEDVEEWDSLMHVTLIHEIEAEFDVRFSAAQVTDLANVGELVDLIDAVAARSAGG